MLNWKDGSIGDGVVFLKQRQHLKYLYKQFKTQFRPLVPRHKSNIINSTDVDRTTTKKKTKKKEK